MLRIEPFEPGSVALMQEQLHLPHLVARVLAIRGATTIEEAERFLRPKLEHLSDPFLLPDVEPAVDALIDAIVSGRRIGVFGDYDADGVTSTALMVNFLEKIGVGAEIYLPARDEGYGLSIGAVRALRERGVDLLVCLDCGSSNIPEIELASSLGMDAIVIDHHEVPDECSRPVALVNPKRKDARFPTRELAACGVTFFFLAALRRSMHARGLLKQPINLKRELDLVALGTVGDMVPLLGDNRILVKFGIEEMQKSPKPWLRSFQRQNLLFQQRVDGYSLSFIIIPRINAAGRVSHPKAALDFLRETGEDESGRLLDELNKANRQRQSLEETIIKEAQEKIETEGLSERYSLVLCDESWPLGVIGIAAQKLAEIHGKPCIIFTRADGVWKGSARSVPGLDLHGTVSTVSSFLTRFGGHKFACGLSLPEENRDTFPGAFEEAVRKCLLENERVVTVDATADFDEITHDLVEQIEMLAPFGFGNPRPSFLFAPSAMSINKGFVKLTDKQNKTWYGKAFLKGPMPTGVDLKVIACPIMKEDLGEKFIHFQVREFVAD